MSAIRDLVAAINRLAAAIETSNTKPARRPSSGYRCIECGELADYRGDHLPACSIYVAPWAGTTPDDASSIAGPVTS